MTSPNWGINYEAFEDDEKHAGKENERQQQKKDENPFIKSDYFGKNMTFDLKNNNIKFMVHSRQNTSKIWQWINKCS